MSDIGYFISKHVILLRLEHLAAKAFAKYQQQRRYAHHTLDGLPTLTLPSGTQVEVLALTPGQILKANHTARVDGCTTFEALYLQLIHINGEPITREQLHNMPLRDFYFIKNHVKELINNSTNE